MLPIMEQFYTIQGEGFHQGKAAYFIRIGGCDVGCIWCDVKESWDADKHPKKTIREIITDIKRYPAEIIVITGGEPLMYNLTDLTTELQKNNYRTHLETSGAYFLTGSWNWICFSPKKFKEPLPSVAEKADEFKVVVYNKSDFAWAEKNRELVSANCRLYLQPEWSKKEIVTPLIIEYIKENPKWEISMQIHKYLNVP
ncbi:MAG: 4Fe-4S cluster-binding domain-containing protein [Fimbriimonadaceae bacterium]|nr:4Fe-4S cluster-binding domain-containing protein [Chitinophagales bacterium]